MRRAAKRDSTEPAIIDALELVGWHVWPLSQEGLPDLLLWREDRGFILMEVKGPRGGIRKEQTAQANFINTTRTPICRTPLEALKAVGAIS